MKKNLFLAIFCIAFSSLLFGQQLKIVLAGDTARINNDTVLVWGNTTSIMDSPFINVINTGIDSVNVYCRRDSLSTPSAFDTSNYFCWVLCYGNATTISPFTELLYRDSTSYSSFQGHYNPLGYAASAYIRYTFFLAKNHNDSSSVVVKYLSTPTSVQSLTGTAINFSAYPNPAQNNVNFNYNIAAGVSSANLKIYNLLGECVQTLPLNTAKNKTTIDLQSIPSGIYVCEIEANGYQSSYKKLVVTH
ncbi:MAG TPA: T9SS type A sorting domain-containing protein [Bacteroidia bacterium]|jgi:hypothetical protein|nr:T9SS type A sorting domain-containing protein [Bacteroidia bacterium]